MTVSNPLLASIICWTGYLSVDVPVFVGSEQAANQQAVRGSWCLVHVSWRSSGGKPDGRGWMLFTFRSLLLDPTVLTSPALNTVINKCDFFLSAITLLRFFQNMYLVDSSAHTDI